MSGDNQPTPQQLRYIALLTAELRMPEPHVDTRIGASKEIQVLLAEKRKQQALKQNALAKAVYNELAWRGRAVNYVLLTDVLREQYPQLRVGEGRVLALLQGRKDLFRRVTADSYFLAGKMEGRAYPLM